eukprot:g4085.t1
MLLFFSLFILQAGLSVVGKGLKDRKLSIVASVKDSLDILTDGSIRSEGTYEDPEIRNKFIRHLNIDHGHRKTIYKKEVHFHDHVFAIDHHYHHHTKIVCGSAGALQFHWEGDQDFIIKENDIIYTEQATSCKNSSMAFQVTTEKNISPHSIVSLKGKEVDFLSAVKRIAFTFDHSPPVPSKNGRKLFEEDISLAKAELNCDGSRGAPDRASRRISLGNGVSCDNCFFYADFGLHLEIDMSYSSGQFTMNTFDAWLYGEVKSKVSLKVDIEKNTRMVVQKMSATDISGNVDDQRARSLHGRNQPRYLTSCSSCSSGKTCGDRAVEAANTNSCSGRNHTKITSAAECQYAANRLGYYWAGQLTSSHYPSGCFRYDSYEVYYNRHSTGGVHSSSSPICQVCLDQPASWTPCSSCSSGKTCGDRAVEAANTNSCSGSHTKITSAAECRYAANRLGYDWAGQETTSYYPSGCYRYYSNSVYYNTHSTGAVHSGSSPICQAQLGTRWNGTAFELHDQFSLSYNDFSSKPTLQLVGDDDATISAALIPQLKLSFSAKLYGPFTLFQKIQCLDLDVISNVKGSLQLKVKNSEELDCPQCSCPNNGRAGGDMMLYIVVGGALLFVLIVGAVGAVIVKGLNNDKRRQNLEEAKKSNPSVTSSTSGMLALPSSTTTDNPIAGKKLRTVSVELRSVSVEKKSSRISLEKKKKSQRKSWEQLLVDNGFGQYCETFRDNGVSKKNDLGKFSDEFLVESMKFSIIKLKKFKRLLKQEKIPSEQNPLKTILERHKLEKLFGPLKENAVSEKSDLGEFTDDELSQTFKLSKLQVRRFKLMLKKEKIKQPIGVVLANSQEMFRDLIMLDQYDPFWVYQIIHLFESDIDVPKRATRRCRSIRKVPSKGIITSFQSDGRSLHLNIARNILHVDENTSSSYITEKSSFFNVGMRGQVGLNEKGWDGVDNTLDFNRPRPGIYLRCTDSPTKDMIFVVLDLGEINYITAGYMKYESKTGNCNLVNVQYVDANMYHEMVKPDFTVEHHAAKTMGEVLHSKDYKEKMATRAQLAESVFREKNSCSTKVYRVRARENRKKILSNIAEALSKDVDAVFVGSRYEPNRAKTGRRSTPVISLVREIARNHPVIILDEWGTSSRCARCKIPHRTMLESHRFSRTPRSSSKRITMRTRATQLLLSECVETRIDVCFNCGNQSEHDSHSLQNYLPLVEAFLIDGENRGPNRPAYLSSTEKSKSKLITLCDDTKDD